MCGITGFIDFTKQTSSDVLYSCAQKMADQIAYRGPDDSGIWIDPRQGVALAHRRLSIIDTTEAGRQPMLSADGRYVLVFNGEIYNFKELRNELTEAFRGHSDTEVLLAALSEWGLEKTLARVNGMFAFALWDRKKRCLHLVCDRLGQKPLYYALIGNTLIFASELKALRMHPQFKSNINRDALASYLRMNYVPAPQSIYQDTHKLMPASYLTIASNTRPSRLIQKNYWDHHALSLNHLDQPFTGSAKEAEYILHHLLKDAVSKRMISDVPLGAFLSGGIDSSLVVALMQSQSSRPVKTFTIGFHEKHFNEANEAKTVAAHLKTEHTELYVTPEDAMAVIPKLPHIYDEPFADMSQIPTYLVSHLARQHVTVALSGDGGDEFFGGYNRHFWVPMFWQRFGKLPYALKYPFLKMMATVPPSIWNTLFGRYVSNPANKCQRLATMLSCRSSGDMYLDLISSWKQPEDILIDGHDQMPSFFEHYFSHTELDQQHQMMYLDATTYLPGDILTKVDRASMAVSLEARSPLLDYRIAEFAWRLPLSSKIRGNKGKQILRNILNQYLPNELIDRPKMGFGVPIGAWLRGPLVEWAEDLLSEQRLQNDGFFKVDEVRKRWHQHQKGQRNWQYCLWNLLMFQCWLQEQNSFAQDEMRETAIAL